MEEERVMWRVSEAKREDGSVMGVFRKLVLEENEFPKQGLDTLAWVTIQVEAHENGLPEREALQTVGQAEDEIVAAIAQEELAMLVAVVNMEGKCDYLFYLRDEGEFQHRVLPILQRLPYQVEIEIGPDPEWQQFREMVG
jgi:hypothetical protein